MEPESQEDHYNSDDDNGHDTDGDDVDNFKLIDTNAQKQADNTQLQKHQERKQHESTNNDHLESQQPPDGVMSMKSLRIVENTMQQLDTELMNVLQNIGYTDADLMLDNDEADTTLHNQRIFDQLLTK
eukprot:UN07362